MLLSMAEIQMPDGPCQGKTRATGPMGPVDSFTDDSTAPSSPGPTTSHPGPGNGSGSVPPGEGITHPKGAG